jgi:hypothetical protein
LAVLEEKEKREHNKQVTFQERLPPKVTPQELFSSKNTPQERLPTKVTPQE